MQFSRQEYWSGLLFPSPRNLPNPGIESGSPELQADALQSEPLGKPIAQLAKHLPAMQETPVRFLSWEDPLEKGKSYSLQYSGLENSLDSKVHGVAES